MHAQGVFSWRCDSVSMKGDGNGVVSVDVSLSVTAPFVPPSGAVVLAPEFRGRGGQLVGSVPPMAVYGTRVYKRATRIAASGHRDEQVSSVMTGGLVRTLSGRLPLQESMDTVTVVVGLYEWSRRSGLVHVRDTVVGSLVRHSLPWPSDMPWKPRVPVSDASRTKTYSGFFPVRFAEGSCGFDLSGNEDLFESLYDCVWGFLGSGFVSVTKAELTYFEAPSGAYADAVRRSRLKGRSVSAALKESGAYRLFVPSVSGGGENRSAVADWIAASSLDVPRPVTDYFSADKPSDASFKVLANEYWGTFDVLRRICFPAVEGVRMSCTFRPVRVKESATLEEVAASCPAALSASDWWTCASLFPVASDAWIGTMTDALRFCPDDTALSFNAVMGLMSKGMFDRAAYASRGLGEGTDARYAKALLSLSRGDVDRFNELFSALCRENPSHHERILYLEPVIDWHRGKCDWDFYPVIKTK